MTQTKEFSKDLIVVRKMYSDVEELLKARFGIDPNDVNFDEETAWQLILNGDNAYDYVERLGQKYDLTDASKWTAEKATIFMKRFNR